MLCALFFAYYVYEPPYRGLYPDVLPERVFGRAQGVQHVFRGIAIGGALIGGGYLFHALAPGAVPRRVRRRRRRVSRPDPPRHGGRRSRTRLRGRADVRGALVARAALGPRRRDVPRREHGVGRDLRGRAHVRRPVRDRRARRAALDVHLHPRGRRRRLHRRRARGGAHRRPRRARAGDHRRVGRVRDGPRRGRSRPGVARLVPRPHLPRRDRRRNRDDPGVGAALQADAAGRAGRDLGARDDDEGCGARHRPARGGRGDRPPQLPPRGDRRLPGALAGARNPDPAGDPARRAAHPGGVGGGPCSRAPGRVRARLRPPSERSARPRRGQSRPKAFSPVSACPTTSVCTSCVPS